MDVFGSGSSWFGDGTKVGIRNNTSNDVGFKGVTEASQSLFNSPVAPRSTAPAAPAYSGPTAAQVAAQQEAARAAAVEAKRVADLRAGFATQKGNIYGSSRDAAANVGIGLNNSILDLVDSLRTGQSTIDNRGVNNDLAKQRGFADIMGSVSRGIQSGGVQLANRNASDSSAAGAIARAYGGIGQRQMSDVGNQYELENQEIGLAQEDLDRQRASGVRKIQGSKEQSVNSIVGEAQNKLAALDAAMIDASIGDRVAIDQEKNNIRNEVLGRLAQYDTQLNQGVGGIQAMGRDARISEATRRGALGQAPAELFDYNTEAPVEFQGTGPFASELPIFTNKYRRQQ